MTASGTSEGAPRRADARRNRERLITAARELLAREGLTAQMVDIARAAGVGTGTLYRHFPSRDELVDAVLERVHLDLAADARQSLGVGEPGAAFTEFLERLTAVLAANRALADDAAARKPNRWQPYNQELADAIDELLVAAQRAGSIRDDVATMDVVRLVVGLTRGRTDSDGWRLGLKIVLDGLRATSR